MARTDPPRPARSNRPGLAAAAGLAIGLVLGLALAGGASSEAPVRVAPRSITGEIPPRPDLAAPERAGARPARRSELAAPTRLGTAIAAPSADLAALLRRAPAAAGAELLLAADEPRLALEHLRARGDVQDDEAAELLARASAALAARGEHEPAFEAAALAYELEPGSVERARELARLDARRALELVERVLADHPECAPAALAEDALGTAPLRLSFPESTALREVLAVCLHELGRDGDAAAALEAPAARVEAPSGCVGWRIEGDAWKWEVWQRARPADVEAALRPVLADDLGNRDVAARRLFELALARGEGAADVVAAYRDGGAHDPLLVARLAERLGDDTGWDEVERLATERPGDEELALPFAEHLDARGRPAEATRVRRAWLERASGHELVRRVAEEPAVWRPHLDARHAELSAEPRDTDELDEALGDLGDAYRALGEERLARELYSRARALDPDDSEWWEALRAASRSASARSR